MPYFLILVLLGIAPAVIAYGKGRNFVLWWIYGALLAPVAFIHALMLQKQDGSRADERDLPYRAGNPDSPLPLMLKCAGVMAIALTVYVGYRVVVSPEAGVAERADAVAALKSATPPEAPRNAESQRETDVKAAAGVDIQVDEGKRSAPVPVQKTGKSAQASEAEQAQTSIPDVKETIPSAGTGQVTTDNPNEPSAPSSVPPIAGNHASPSKNDHLAAAPKEPAKNSDVTAVGEIVRMVQVALAKRGYDPGESDGRADTQTRDAVRKFQADKKLPQTGAIDYSVLRALGLVGQRVYAFQRPPDVPLGR